MTPFFNKFFQYDKPKSIIQGPYKGKLRQQQRHKRFPNISYITALTLMLLLIDGGGE